MKNGLTRRQLIVAAAATAVTTAASADQDSKLPLAADLVKDFVIAGHGNFAKVQEMLAAEPKLLNATWDWGGGDFETALEGAGHMGNREIALFLIGKGARINIFQAAMLGDLDLVKSFLKSYPNLKSSSGPHGIPLKVHAQKGGKEAAEVLAFLESLD